MLTNKADCIAALQAKQAQVGKARYACRGDFTCDEVAAIKAFLGPWPRALEKAGIKPEREKKDNKQKRISAKQRRTMALKNKKRCEKCEQEP